MKPSQVFIQGHMILDTATDKKSNGSDTHGLIDFVDFGTDANKFLINIGVRSYPTPSVLAELLIDRQASYFASAINDKGLLKSKVHVYLGCLARLTSAVTCSNELFCEPVNKRLTTNAWCLGVQTIISPNGDSEEVYKIVVPNDIYLDDDARVSSLFQPLLAPLQPELSKLYESFGAQWLSTCVNEKKERSGTTNWHK